MGVIIDIEARDHREAGRHLEAVKVGLDLLEQSEKILAGKFSSVENFTQSFLNSTYSLYSASDNNLFVDYLRIFKLYNSITSRKPNEEPPSGYFNHSLIMFHNVRANLFCYYEGIKTWQDLHTSVAQLELWAVKSKKDSNAYESAISMISMGRKALKEHDPYYTVSFRAPCSIPVPDGDYEISYENAEKISIQTLKLDDLTSSIGDRYFSQIKITFKGFTSTDNYWHGPLITKDSEPYNIGKCLGIINDLISRSKLIDSSLRLCGLNHSDIGRSTTEQFYCDGSMYHQTINFGMGGDALVDVLTRQELSLEDTDILFNGARHGKITLYKELFSQSLIHRDRNAYASAFYMLNSAFESMLIYYLDKLSGESNKNKEYDLFMKGLSRCDSCELYSSSDLKDPPIDAMVPTTFSQIKFLKEISDISGSKCRRLNSLTSKIRSDSLRNDLVHGKISSVPTSVIDLAFTSYHEFHESLACLSHA